MTMQLLDGILGRLPVFHAAFEDALGGASQFIFFKLIFNFLDSEVEAFRHNLMGESMVWVSGVALTLLTIWILWQGWLIVTGRSRESMMSLVVNSMRSMVIVLAATSMMLFGNGLYGTFTNTMPKEVMKVVTGSDDDPIDKIDENMQVMSLAMVAIDALPTNGGSQGEGDVLKGDKNRAMWFTGIGVAGPAVVGGALLLMYKIALALFVGLGPLFILSLLFEQTKSFFGKWLYYGIGTMFSLAVLAFMMGVATKIVGAVAAALSVQYVLSLNSGGTTEGINSMALQQGGVGLIMTILLVTAPMMAASFFGGAIGSYAGSSMFGSVGRNSTGQVTDTVMPVQGQGRSQRSQERGNTDGGGSQNAGSSYNSPGQGTRLTGNSATPQRDEVRKTT